VLCGELAESRYVSANEFVLEGSKACTEISQRHYTIWIMVRQTKGVKLQGFMDVNWPGSPLDRKSTSVGIFNLGSIAVSWYSRK